MKQGWVYKKFSEVFNLQMGKTPSRDNNSYWGGDNVWVSISDLKGKYIGGSKEHITDLGVSSSGITKVPKGTAIMSFKLTIGRAAIAECDLYTNEAIMSFAPLQKDTLLADYIYYYLRGCKWTGANKAVMGQTLNKKTISENIFAYPSIDEQKAICSLLDNLNLVIEKKKQQIEELDNLTQSLFFDMFGDPVANDKGWSIDRLEANCEVSSAKRVLVEDVVESGIPFLRGTELTALSKSVSSKNVTFTMFITPEHYERVKAVTGVPKKGDILIPSINSEGITWVVDTDEPFYFKDGRVIWVHVNTNVFVSQYLSSAITRILKANYSLLTSGATFLELKLFIIRDLLVPIPPLPLQQAFAEKVKAIEQQKELINQSIKDVQTLFDAEMDYYFGD